MILINWLVAAIIVISFPLITNAQWAAPSATPPNNNASTPINVGSTAQVKTGGISAGSFYTGGGSAVMGSMGVGIASPSYKLDVVGRVNADSQSGSGGYISSGNYGGTGSAAYFPSGLWSNGSSAWIYGNVNTNGPITDTSSRFSINPAGNTYFNGGNVGIGIASPSYKLQANGDIYANGGWLRVSGASGLYFESYGGGWHMSDATWIRSYNSKPVYMSAGLDTGAASGIGCSGGLGGGYTFRVCGTAAATAFYYTSDRNLKKDIAPLGGNESLSRILKLEGVSFKWKDGTNGSDMKVGLIAQDVENVYPEVVGTSEAGVKSVEYGNLVAPLIEAIKEQQRQINELKAEIEALKFSN